MWDTPKTRSQDTIPPIAPTDIRTLTGQPGVRYNTAPNPPHKGAAHGPPIEFFLESNNILVKLTNSRIASGQTIDNNICGISFMDLSRGVNLDASLRSS